MKLKSVLISDAVDQPCIDLLKENGISVTVKTKLPKDELIQELKKHDALIVRSETKVTADIINAVANLKLVGRAGTGVDNIDLDAATKRGVIVMNTPGGNSISACELTCTLIATLARHVIPACSALKKSSWERKQYTGTELYGKTLAILGLGRIGREVARRMQAFGMKTIGYDPIITTDAAAEFNVEKLELNDIWPRADFITVHTPLIPQTKNLINTETLALCRRGVRIINVARGGIVDELALLEALESGQCGGAALDVFTEEPPRSEYLIKLLAHPNVVATPHLGASTNDAQRRVAVEIAEQFVALSQGTAVSGIINAPIVATAFEANNAPWIKLAQYLGCISTHLLSRPVEITVETYGSDLSGLRNLDSAVVLGLLAGASQNGMNLINAPSYAKEAGIILSSNHQNKIPNSLIEFLNASISALRVTVNQPGKTVQSVLGTVRDGLPILLTINDKLNFLPQGLALKGHVALFVAQDPRNTLISLLGETSTMKAQLISMNIAVNKENNIGYVALNTTKPLDTLTHDTALLVAQHTFA